MSKVSAVPVEAVQARIFVLRGTKVMLDSDLAALYEVNVKALNQAVKRNIDRFPDDFMFQLTDEEHRFVSLRSQAVTLEKGRGMHRKYAPYAFTEHGVGMMSGVLRSPRAVQVNIAIIRAFVALRRYAITHEELRKRIAALESKTDKGHKKVMEAIEKLMEPDVHKPTLGFGRKKVG